MSASGRSLHLRSLWYRQWEAMWDRRLTQANLSCVHWGLIAGAGEDGRDKLSSADSATGLPAPVSPLPLLGYKLTGHLGPAATWKPWRVEAEGGGCGKVEFGSRSADQTSAVSFEVFESAGLSSVTDIY